MANHPLRPKEGVVLVCEGEDDLRLLSGTFSNNVQTNQILVYSSGGSANLSSLANILSPSTYVVDRDFNLTSNEALATFTNTKRRTVWQCVDIEGYLIHPDWLMQFVEKVQRSSGIRIRNAPANFTQLEDQISEIAQNLIYDHAGRRTIENVVKQLPPSYELKPKVVKKQVSAGASASDYDEWAEMLESERKRVISMGEDLCNSPLLDDILTIFEEEIQRFQTYTSIDDIRREFSGKRILQALVLEWGLAGGKTNKDPWQILQGQLINFAIDYSKEITGFLSDDARLGDFGLLASKILETQI